MVKNRGPQFRKFISYESHLFGKCSKFNLDLKNAHKNGGKVFWFSHICIWIVCIELSLLRRVYLSSAVNMLAKSLKTFHVTRSNFFQLNYLHNDQQIWSGSFHWKCSNFDVDLKNAHKNWEKVFCFSDRCIWIVCIELSLLRREYSSWSVNVLTKRLKTLHVTKSNFFELNYFHRDMWL